MWRLAGSLMLGTFRGALAGAATVAVYLTAVFVAGDPRLALLLFLALSAVFSFLAILIHELGHAIAAWMSGWRVRQIVVGHIGFAPHTGKWGLERRPIGPSDIGGWVRATPGPSNIDRSGEIMFILGGVLANALSSVVCLIAAEFLLSEPGSVALARGFAAASLILAIANLDPWRGPERSQSDGRSLILVMNRLRKGRKPNPTAEAEHRVLLDLVDGCSPHPNDLALLRDIPLEQAVVGTRGDLLKSAAITSGDLVWLRRLILESERRGSALESHELSALALSAALIDSDERAGRSYLDRVPAEVRETDLSYLRALAAVEHIGGRSAKAREVVATIHRLTGDKRWGDKDDWALFQAIENGSPLPKLAHQMSSTAATSKQTQGTGSLER